jgi:hypothetical protein
MGSDSSVVEGEGDAAAFWLSILLCLCPGLLYKRGQQVLVKEEVIAVDQKFLIEGNRLACVSGWNL